MNIENSFRITNALVAIGIACCAMMVGCSQSNETAELCDEPVEREIQFDRNEFRGDDQPAPDFGGEINEEAAADKPQDGLALDMEDQITESSPTKKLTINRDFTRAQPPVMPPSVRSKQRSKSFQPPMEKSAASAAAPPQLPGLDFDRFSNRGPDEPERAMAVMAPAEIETELPPAQTNIDVYYATDRQSKFGIAPNDWLNIHLGALISLAIYLVTFAAVFLSKRKLLYGTLAFGSLVAFLFLGQTATVTWQKQKRLASNNDPIYLSEVRPSFADETLDYGKCSVTIPPNHKIGHLDSPTLFKLEFSEDPENHVVVNRVIKCEKDHFYDGLRGSIAESGSEQALVFVHGYNVSFENAVKRTAQIVHDLKFDGTPICYSWSSHGALADYTKDMANADATVMALQSFLEETIERTGQTTIHLVAHSMGNRALLQALDRIAVSKTDNEKMFGQLVMAAPDVSARDFRKRFAPSAMRLANSVTLYASSRDRALLASTEIHGHNRAGMAGDQLVVMEGLDTIDVSEIDTSLIGHSYYGDHPELIKDLRALVELSQPASQRKWLTRIINPGSTTDYFRFTQRLSRSQIDSEFQPSRR